MIDAAELIAITLHAERTNPDDPDSLPWHATDVEVQALYLDDARAILVMLAAAGWLNKEGADTLRAEVEHWKKLAEEPPEPCPLDHSCDEDDPCSCWCPLHDCPLPECPSFRSVEAGFAAMRSQHDAIVAKVHAERDAAVADRDHARKVARQAEANYRDLRGEVTRLRAVKAPPDTGWIQMTEGGP